MRRRWARRPRRYPRRTDASPSPVTFEEASRLATKTYCGGPTKDHILESAGSGVALFDYDGDGRLDVYLVTRGELDARSASASPHRNALYRNLGGWKFEDVSQAGGRGRRGVGQRRVRRRLRRRRPPRSLRHELRPELPLPQQRRRHLRRTWRRAAGVAAGGWSTGCTFFDADADGDLDLYVARYVEHDLGRRVGAPKRTLTLARRAARSWLGRGPARRGRPLLREPRRRPLRRGHRRARPRRRAARLRLRRGGHRLRRRRLGWTSSSPTTRTRTSSTATAARDGSRAWGCWRAWP